uniref:Uncharacterized protein n=1 Tax=Rhizophora mucronata TaxID=61149 RepID=A0A2P2MZH9_RHIMU
MPCPRFLRFQLSKYLSCQQISTLELIKWQTENMHGTYS